MTQEGLPLAGIRVLELGHIVAGPGAAFILAELGADVIKIETPDRGDASRNMPEPGNTFYFLNRNKRSLAVDLKRLEGREIFRRLVLTADVVVDNYAPGTLTKLGIDYEWARQINQRVIYCSIKGYLPGPNESQLMLDELAQMAGGLAYMTGLPGKPMRAGASVVDIGAATYGVIGVLAALNEREETGEGQYSQAGLFETVAFWVGQHIARTQLSGQPPEPQAMSQGGWGVYQLFPSRDGRHVFIAVTSNRHWELFCQAFGLQDLLADPELDNNSKRVAHKARLAERIAQVTRTLAADEITARLQQSGIPFAPVNSPKDLVDDPHLNATGRLLAFDVPGHPGLRTPTLPFTIGEAVFRVRRPPPGLGEHTAELLRDLVYPDSEIQALKDSGVISSHGGMIHFWQGGEPK